MHNFTICLSIVNGTYGCGGDEKKWAKQLNCLRVGKSIAFCWTIRGDWLVGWWLLCCVERNKMELHKISVILLFVICTPSASIKKWSIYSSLFCYNCFSWCQCQSTHTQMGQHKFARKQEDMARAHPKSAYMAQWIRTWSPESGWKNGLAEKCGRFVFFEKNIIGI
jgi:hypothetical protein